MGDYLPEQVAEELDIITEDDYHRMVLTQVMEDDLQRRFYKKHFAEMYVLFVKEMASCGF